MLLIRYKTIGTPKKDTINILNNTFHIPVNVWWHMMAQFKILPGTLELQAPSLNAYNKYCI